eukprot:4648545-Alexandrium_andersonii.AAC.2
MARGTFGQGRGRGMGEGLGAMRAFGLGVGHGSFQHWAVVLSLAKRGACHDRVRVCWGEGFGGAAEVRACSLLQRRDRLHRRFHWFTEGVEKSVKVSTKWDRRAVADLKAGAPFGHVVQCAQDQVGDFGAAASGLAQRLAKT